MKKLAAFNESDFELFRSGIESGRLNPVRIGKILIVFPIGISIFLYGAQLILSSSKILNDQWGFLLRTQWFIVVLLTILSLLFFIKHMSLRFQRLQMGVLIVSFLLLVFTMTFAGICLLTEGNPSLPFALYFWLYVAGSVIVLILSLLRVVVLLHKGAFKKNGTGLLGIKDAEHSMNFFSAFMIIVPFTIIGGILARSGLSIGNLIFSLLSLGLSFLIYAFVITEYLFILYCKVRFSSFQITFKEQKQREKDSQEVIEYLKGLEQEDKRKESAKKKK